MHPKINSPEHSTSPEMSFVISVTDKWSKKQISEGSSPYQVIRWDSPAHEVSLSLSIYPQSPRISSTVIYFKASNMKVVLKISQKCFSEKVERWWPSYLLISMSKSQLRDCQVSYSLNIRAGSYWPMIHYDSLWHLRKYQDSMGQCACLFLWKWYKRNEKNKVKLKLRSFYLTQKKQQECN